MNPKSPNICGLSGTLFCIYFILTFGFLKFLLTGYQTANEEENMKCGVVIYFDKY